MCELINNWDDLLYSNGWLLMEGNAFPWAHMQSHTCMCINMHPCYTHIVIPCWLSTLTWLTAKSSESISPGWLCLHFLSFFLFLSLPNAFLFQILHVRHLCVGLGWEMGLISFYRVEKFYFSVYSCALQILESQLCQDFIIFLPFSLWALGSVPHSIFWVWGRDSGSGKKESFDLLMNGSGIK
jgi:hypothetical protein